jgi:rhodanese-related sulfurtransferase
MTELPIEIDVASVKQLLSDASAPDDTAVVLLDVREPDEHEFASIQGSRLFPMSQLQERIGELEPLKERHIVVHCHHGGRSLRVTEFLRSQGFSNVQNMTGGIDVWSTEIDAQVPRY